MTAQPDYPWIRAWCHMLGSYAYYTKRQGEQARQDHAPGNAIYKQQDGSWATTDDSTNPEALRSLGLPDKHV